MVGGADFLWKSINMLCEQTFQDFEIVFQVVNLNKEYLFLKK